MPNTNPYGGSFIIPKQLHVDELSFTAGLLTMVVSVFFCKLMVRWKREAIVLQDGWCPSQPISRRQNDGQSS